MCVCIATLVGMLWKVKGLAICWMILPMFADVMGYDVKGICINESEVYLSA